MSVSNTHPRLYKLLDQLKSEKGEVYAGRMDAFVHIILGVHQIVGLVHCDVCGPDAVYIGNAVIKKAVLLAANEGIDNAEFKTCLEAAKDDLAAFEEQIEDSEKQAKDVLSRVSTKMQH